MFPKALSIPSTLRAFLFSLLLTAVPPFAEARELSKMQWQFMKAITSGDIDRARDLRSLSDIDVMDFNGQPFIRWLFAAGGGPNFLTDEAFDYVFKELKQPFDLPVGDSPTTTNMALFCLNTGQASHSRLGNLTGLQNTLARVQYAIGTGASAKHLPNMSWEFHDRQALPQCVKEYFRWNHNSQTTAVMLQIIELLIQGGADPNYGLPIIKAAETYDVPLLQMLQKHGARVDNVFPVTHETAFCNGSSLPQNTIIAKLPNPRDMDVSKAWDFLSALHQMGVMVNAPQLFVGFSGTKCEKRQETLLQRALNSGQTEYAKMVKDLAEQQTSVVPNSTGQGFTEGVGTDVPVGGVTRIVTDSFNVREQPNINGRLLGTLGPNAVFELEEESQDREWILISAPPTIRGWANAAVVNRNSTLNTRD